MEWLIEGNLDCIEPGLRLVRRQASIPVGRIDILCRDGRGDYVVIELKRFGANTREVVAQIATYMGYVKSEMASEGEKVRGVIVVGRPDEALVYAARAIPNLEIKVFAVSLKNHRDQAAGGGA